MGSIIRNMFCLVLVEFLMFSCVDSKTNNVDIAIYSDNKSIKSELRIEKIDNEKKYIHISLTNMGDKADYIDSVKIVIKPFYKVDQNSRLLFGGTCMGRTPVKQTTIADTNSESGTFLLIKQDESTFIHTGILTWNTFLPKIRFDEHKGIMIFANGEHKPLQPGEKIQFEKILINNADSWQDILFDYGKEIAIEQNVQPKYLQHFKGWSTWDYYGRVYDTKDVFDNIDKLYSEQKDANIIQIDGGWWTARGDYLSVRKNLQGGMKAIADYAKSKGYRAGIHLDGFRGDKNSELFKQHPDWFLKDQDGQVICQQIDKGDTFMQYIYYDYSNPAVCEYMKNVLRTIKNNWGFNYFKIDFMRYGLYESIMAEHGLNSGTTDKIVSKINTFNNTMTSVERTRAALQAMRLGMGDAYFLACSSIFGPTLGIVDGLRTGADICPTFDFYQSCVLQNAGNFYLNQTVVQNDADYLVVRNKDDEEPERAWGKDKFGGNTTLSEAEMWSDYIALFGGPKINSDNLLTLRPERKELITNAFSFNTAKRFIPLDLWNHAKDKDDAFNVILAENEDGVYIAFFNWDSKVKRFNISGFSDELFYDAKTKSNYHLHNNRLQLVLKSHNSTILKVENTSFDKIRKKIKVY